MYRRFMKQLCILMLLCLLPVTALADPTLIVEDDTAGVPQAVLDQLVADYPNAGVITVTAHHTETTPAEGTADELTLSGRNIGVLIAMLLAGVWTMRRR